MSAFSIYFDDSISLDSARAVAAELAEIEGVDRAGADSFAGPTPELVAWVQLAGAILGSAGGLLALATGILSILKNPKKSPDAANTKVEIERSDGTRIAIEGLSPEQLASFLRSVSG